ncbi:MAG: FAD-linked oxidase C-terminal domain-containing protein, partial [Pseudomonadota bacterium]|nr:FAD-linked oxidase C-terminal domain-containing protein [Pseudomonadota bacterium]
HGKIKYLEAEHGAPSLAVMASIKRALDPENIMNPGKILSIN